MSDTTPGDGDLEAAIAQLTATTKEVVEYAQAVAYMALGLLNDVKQDLCVPLRDLQTSKVSPFARHEIVNRAIGTAAAMIDKIDFALTAKLGIEAGTA